MSLFYCFLLVPLYLWLRNSHSVHPDILIYFYIAFVLEFLDLPFKIC